MFTIGIIPIPSNAYTTTPILNTQFEPSIYKQTNLDGLCSKTIADCVEALIGAYYVGGGLTAALHVMQWLGMNVGHDSPLVHEAITRTLLRSNVPKAYYINSLELKLGYEFSTKGLLLEAMTHPSSRMLTGAT